MRRILLPTALLATALILTGCAAGGSGSATDQSAPQAPISQEGGTAEYSSTGGGDAVKDGDLAQSDINRDVITTGWVTVLVESPMDAARDAVRITEQAGGRIDSRSEYAATETNGGSAMLTLRIPADDVTEILDQLKELGEVQEVSLNATDVTMQTQDLDARISALSASIERLLALMANATDTDALITLETAVSDRQAQLESLQAEQRYLSDQVAMSTITLNLTSKPTVVVPEPEAPNVVTALLVGWNAFVGFLSGLVVVLAVMLPWLVLGAIVTFVVVFVVKRRRAAKAKA